MSEREREREREQEKGSGGQRERERLTYHIHKCNTPSLAMGPSRSTSFYILYTNETVEVSILDILIPQLPKAGEDP